MATTTKMITKNIDKIKASANNLHNNALDISDDIVDGALISGKKWQKLFAKAMQNGTVLFEQQQDIFVNTLEAVIDQYGEGSKRLKQLFDLSMPTASPKAKVATPKVVAKVAKTAKASVKKTRKTVTKKAKVSPLKAKLVNNDDLRIIEGVGPKIQSILNKAGISTFAVLAATDVKTLKNILASAGPRFAKYNPSNWRKEAKLAAAGKMDKLKELQNKAK